ncbi:hypothetical protein BKA67DRAFT_373418 [Truncatella angustata]|uniref:Uncharacterized protein n=1 Tax=Truncatella angustata TaxID=152316 RepID=A0A9P8ZVJ9_9PEZI|nr:uncharacterized protein BKA67DRAFT_373418 [Truncatella angustata]KAH6648819.1 hypothetical protein BKA67DRAFT_373418 [Truncatella angustata]KAH8200882.1 hypothetical protein TruAng_004968 [Truncatella angustata]
MHCSSALMLAAGSFLSTASAQSVPQALEENRGGAYRSGTVNYIDDSDFDTALQRPNATGAVSFVGRNVSAAYPGNDASDWSLILNVTSGVVKPGEDNRELTGTALSIQQPPSLPGSGSNNGTDGFQVCVNLMRIVPNATVNYTRLAADDRGTCGSYLSEECISQVRDLAAANFKENGTCAFIDEPPVSCGNTTVYRGYSGPAFGLPAPFYQQDWTAFTYGSDPPVSSNNRTAVDLDYDEQVKAVWPVLLTWGYTNTSTQFNDTAPATSLACVSATDFTQGSRVPNATEDGSGNGTNSGGRMGVDKTLIGITIFATAFAVLT